MFRKTGIEIFDEKGSLGESGMVDIGVIKGIYIDSLNESYVEKLFKILNFRRIATFLKKRREKHLRWATLELTALAIGQKAREGKRVFYEEINNGRKEIIEIPTLEILLSWNVDSGNYEQ